MWKINPCFSLVTYGGLLQSFSRLKPCPFLTATKQLVDRTKSPFYIFFSFLIIHFTWVYVTIQKNRFVLILFHHDFKACKKVTATTIKHKTLTLASHLNLSLPTRCIITLNVICMMSSCSIVSVCMHNRDVFMSLSDWLNSFPKDHFPSSDLKLFSQDERALLHTLVS